MSTDSKVKPTAASKLRGIRGESITIFGVGGVLLGVVVASWADSRAYQAESRAYQVESRAEHAEIRGEIRELRTELKADIDKLRTELRSDMGKLDDRLRTVEISTGAGRSPAADATQQKPGT